MIIKYSHTNPFTLYTISSILILSYIISTTYLLDIKFIRFDLLKFFYTLVIPQYISISLLFNFGILGNPNHNIKLFLIDKNVSSIVNDNTIYLYNVDSKIQTLLSYYLPSSQVLSNIEDINIYKYIITSDINSLDNFNEIKVFKPIKTFDKQTLFMNTSY